MTQPLYYTNTDVDYLYWIISHELNLLFDWFKANKLSLNLRKTVYMAFFVPQDLAQTVTNGEIKIPNVYTTKFLGIHIDDQLNWKHHYTVLYDKLKLNKRIVIYRFRCGRVDCNEEYIQESARIFAERFREHMKAPSPIHDYHNITGHELSLDNFSIVGREDQSIARTNKEAILIRVNDLSLNRNIGEYQLPHICDEGLVKSPEL